MAKSAPASRGRCWHWRSSLPGTNLVVTHLPVLASQQLANDLVEQPS
jgi:hypothetical protein